MAALWIGMTVVVGIGAAWLQRRATAASAAMQAQPAPLPRRIANPRLARRPEISVWLLRASPGCELSPMLDGRRFATGEAIPLPMPGCRLTGCECRYEPVANRRRHHERRNVEERRGALRFDASDERRGHAERRGADAWTLASTR